MREKCGSRLAPGRRGRWQCTPSPRGIHAITESVTTVCQIRVQMCVGDATVLRRLARPMYVSWCGIDVTAQTGTNVWSCQARRSLALYDKRLPDMQFMIVERHACDVERHLSSWNYAQTSHILLVYHARHSHRLTYCSAHSSDLFISVVSKDFSSFFLVSGFRMVPSLDICWSEYTQ